MSRLGRLPVAAAAVVTIALLAVGLIAFAPTAAAQDGGSYVAEQGDECIDVATIGDGSETVEEFYDYRSPETEPSSNTYSSYGTPEFQEDNTSHLLLFEGAEGTSVVVIHEELHENASEGSYGGTAEMTFSDLPADTEWAVMDDDYEDQVDDTFENDGTTMYAEWYWAEGRTDGGAIRDVADGSSFTVDATFNEGTWGGTYDGMVHDWMLVTGDEDGVEREALDMSEPVTISPGTCSEGGPGDPDVDLVGPDDAETDEIVTFDASDSETGSNPTYEWFVDGERVEDAEGPTHETAFADPGEYEVRVEVTDDSGSGAAETTIEIVDGPTAQFETRPSSAEAGDRIAFDANESSGNVDGYHWEFGDGTAADGELVTHTYEEPGTYEVELTVIGESGATDSVTGAVEITEPVGPEAVLEFPETVTAGETVTLDARGSETGDNPTYDWYINEEHIESADGPTHQASFAEAGDHPIRVEVRDDGGTDSVGATIHVEERPDDSDGDGDGSSGDGDGSSGDGSGDGSGGGDPHDGTGGASLPGDEPIVDADDGTVTVTVYGAEAGESVEVDLTGVDTGDATVQPSTIEFVPAEDADELTVRFETVDRSVPGQFADRNAIEPTSASAIESITYEFAIDDVLLESGAVDPNDVTAYADEGEWTSLGTETQADGDRYLVTTTTEGTNAVGIGADGPALLVSDVETGGTVTDGELDLVATVRNTGSDAVDRDFTFANGDATTEVPVSLEPGEETVLEASVAVDDPDDTDLRVGATRPSVLLVTATDLSVDQRSVEPGESVAVEAELRNSGPIAGEHETELVLAESVAAVETVQMGPGESATVTFEQRMESPGTYELSVGDQRETVEVEGEGDDGQGATEDTPGFGAVTALVAILLGTVAYRRRTS